MNLGAAVEVAIGLFLLYLTLSLVITAGNEFISQFLDLRARHLRNALKAMVAGKEGDGDDSLKKLLAHPFLDVAGQVGSHKLFGFSLPTATGLPSYIKSGDFTAALSTVVKLSTNMHNFAQAIDKLPDGSLKASLAAVREKATVEGSALEKAVETWFDTMMERVTGAYKRAMNFIGLIAAVGLAVLLNANTLSVAESLWKNEALRASVVRLAENHTNCVQKAGTNQAQITACGSADAAWKTLEKLPIGWKDFSFKDRHCAHSLLGWLITGLALSLGAPFWFDMLSRAMTLRAALSPSQSRPGGAATGTPALDPTGTPAAATGISATAATGTPGIAGTGKSGG